MRYRKIDIQIWLGNHETIQSTSQALKQVLIIACCEIFNTDQGSQFTSKSWIELLTSNHITISMDGRGRYLDNIFVERLWRSVKYECIYLQEFWSVKEVRNALTHYFYYYNFDRLHEALDYKTPYQVYSYNKKN